MPVVREYAIGVLRLGGEDAEADAIASLDTPGRDGWEAVSLCRRRLEPRAARRDDGSTSSSSSDR